MGAPECGGRDEPGRQKLPTGAFRAWWLAPTSRWRTAPARSPEPDQDLSPAVESEDKCKRREALAFGIWDPPARPGNLQTWCRCYLISTFAPASSTFFLMASASALEMPSFSALG